MKRLKSLPALNRKLWKIFSEYIRRKDMDEYGCVVCISCGSVKDWRESHAGHYIPKSVSLYLRFDERNVHPQCAGCNTFRHGNLAQYAIALRKRYGEGILEELESVRHTATKYSRANYEEKILYYTEKLKALK